MAPIKRKTKRMKRSKSKKRIGGDGENDYMSYVWSSNTARINAENNAHSASFNLTPFIGENPDKLKIRKQHAFKRKMNYYMEQDKKPKTSIFSMFSRKKPAPPPEQAIQQPTPPVQSFAEPVQQSAQPVQSFSQPTQQSQPVQSFSQPAQSSQQN